MKTNLRLLRSCCALAALAVAMSGNAFAAIADDSADVTTTVAEFHAALKRGDGASAMKLLAPDAVILESGFAETRAEYEAHHLPEDIRFAQTVSSTQLECSRVLS